MQQNVLNKSIKIGLLTLSCLSLVACGTKTPTTKETSSEAAISSSQASASLASESTTQSSSESQGSSDSLSEKKGETAQAKFNDDDHYEDYAIITADTGRPEGEFTLKSAIEKFQSSYPKAEIIKLSYEEDDSVYYYEIKGIHEQKFREVKYEAQNGEVVHEYEKFLPKHIKKINLAEVISLKDAYARALESAKGSFGKDAASAEGEFTIKEWALDYDDGRLVYKFEFKQSSHDDDLKVKIDAQNGTTLRVS